ncbi:MAG: (4Fe-4S)-binding protein [Ferruginibacter sp.]|nr:(4Fe-4S)-binding protein [Ferruginibacter sp.]
MALTSPYYYNQDAVVLWQTNLYVHSAICFKGLPKVFDP